MGTGRKVLRIKQRNRFKKNEKAEEALDEVKYCLNGMLRLEKGHDIDRHIPRATNDPHQMSYIFQQISVAIIRGNALAITASSRKYAQELVERH